MSHCGPTIPESPFPESVIPETKIQESVNSDPRYKQLTLEEAVYLLTKVEPQWREKVKFSDMKDRSILTQVFGSLGAGLDKLNIYYQQSAIFGKIALWEAELKKESPQWEVEYAAKYYDEKIPDWYKTLTKSDIFNNFFHTAIGRRFSSRPGFSSDGLYKVEKLIGWHSIKMNHPVARAYYAKRQTPGENIWIKEIEKRLGGTIPENWETIKDSWDKSTILDPGVKDYSWANKHQPRRWPDGMLQHTSVNVDGQRKLMHIMVYPTGRPASLQQFYFSLPLDVAKVRKKFSTFEYATEILNRISDEDIVKGGVLKNVEIAGTVVGTFSSNIIEVVS